VSRFGLFSLQRVDYAVPLARLRKVLHQPRVHLLPRLPRELPRVVVADGGVVPVVDLLCKAETESQLSAPEYLILVDSECGPLALPADTTCGIVAEQKGTRSVTGEEGSPWWCGSFHYQNKTFQILDIDVLAIGLTQECPVLDPDSEGARRNQ